MNRKCFSNLICVLFLALNAIIFGKTLFGFCSYFGVVIFGCLAVYNYKDNQ